MIFVRGVLNFFSLIQGQHLLFFLPIAKLPVISYLIFCSIFIFYKSLPPYCGLTS